MEIRKNRKSLIRESKIVELTRKFKFDRYSFSRLTDNKIFEFTRNYLAAFVEGQFSHINGLTRTSCEIWLKNEGLPIRESLIELYLWFLNERGVGRKEAMEDLKLLKEHYYEMKEMSYYNQMKRRLDQNGK